jgi:hypothetical protein
MQIITTALALFPFHLMNVHTNILQIIMMSTARSIMNFVAQAADDYDITANTDTLSNLTGEVLHLHNFCYIYFNFACKTPNIKCMQLDLCFALLADLCISSFFLHISSVCVTNQHCFNFSCKTPNIKFMQLDL